MTSEKSETKLKSKTEDILEPSKEELALGGTFAHFFPPPKLKFSDIRKRVLLHFMRDGCSGLKQELDKYGLTKEEITKFFLEEGEILLSYSLIDAVNDEPLQFLIEVVPIQALQAVLGKDDFYVLQSFLLGEVGLEEYGLYNKEKEEVQIEKFKGLLSIDKEGVVNFMRENAANPDFESDKIKANFKKALEYTAENASSQGIAL